MTIPRRPSKGTPGIARGEALNRTPVEENIYRGENGSCGAPVEAEDVIDALDNSP